MAQRGTIGNPWPDVPSTYTQLGIDGNRRTTHVQNDPNISRELLRRFSGGGVTRWRKPNVVNDPNRRFAGIKPGNVYVLYEKPRAGEVIGRYGMYRARGWIKNRPNARGKIVWDPLRDGKPLVIDYRRAQPFYFTFPSHTFHPDRLNGVRRNKELAGAVTRRWAEKTIAKHAIPWFRALKAEKERYRPGGAGYEAARREFETLRGRRSPSPNVVNLTRDSPPPPRRRRRRRRRSPSVIDLTRNSPPATRARKR